jgi:hypothetical protein
LKEKLEPWLKGNITVDAVRQHRSVYAAFKDDVKRLTSVDWSVVFFAGDPDTLEQVRQWAKRPDWQHVIVKNVQNYRRWRKQQQEENERQKHPALADTDPEAEKAAWQCGDAIKDIPKLIDRAIKYIKPYVHRLPDEVREQLRTAFVGIRTAIDEAIAVLDEPSSQQYREAAE